MAGVTLLRRRLNIVAARDVVESRRRDHSPIGTDLETDRRRGVGDLVFDEAGHAVRGLLVRLLVLPNGLAGTRDTLAWMAANLSLSTWFSLMAQYAPAYRATEYLELSRPVTQAEYHDLLDYADELGFENFYTQSPASRDVLRPDFERPRPFDSEFDKGGEQ